MRHTRPLLGALAVVLMVSGCASYPSTTNTAGSSAPPSTSSAPSAPVSPTANAAPPAQTIPSGYPPAKASVLAAEDRARLKNSGKPIVPASFPPIHGTLVQGIYDPGQDPQLRDEFSITNAWAGPGLGAWEAVDAGSIPIATGEGLTDHADDAPAVLVFTASTDPDSALPQTIVGTFKPNQALRGQFTITAVNGTTITLSLSGSQKIYHFDTSSLTFR
jgi:hypothetical protein